MALSKLSTASAHTRLQAFCNGAPSVTSSKTAAGSGKLEKIASSAGLLIDVYRYCIQAGRSIDPLKAEKYTVDELKAALKAQRSKLKADSIVLVRTGWVQAYLDAPRILGASVQSCQPAVRICEKSHAAFIK